MIRLQQFTSGILGIGAAAVFIRQCRKPEWIPGRLIAMQMNFSHGRLTEWGLTHVRIEPNFTILDVGCGGGRTIQRLAALAPAGKVYGIDYSKASVATARRTNAALIADGRVDIRSGTVSALPFDDGTFDVVTAVETHYYWPSLIDDFRGIRRVLKPGGSFVIIAEVHRGQRMDWLYAPAMRMLRGRYLTPDEHRDLLARAGFLDIRVDSDHERGWMTVVARTPA